MENSVKRRATRKKLRKALKTFKRFWRGFRKTFGVIGATLLSLVLIVLLTGAIVATVLTVYVLNFMDSTSEIDIYDLETGGTTYIYAMNNDTGEYEELYSADNGIQSIPIDISVVPQHVRDAFVFAEDERFYLHDGVDYKRTFAAFANMFINIYDTDQGGSTITQQLVKNITGDDARSGLDGPKRKIREIFRSMDLERRYAKQEILEAYMNYTSFGGGSLGVEYASEKYFGKTVSELTIAEGAALAAIPKSPERNNPFADEEENRGRQLYILKQMYDNGAITKLEYDAAVDQEMIFANSDKYKALHPEDQEDEEETDDGVTSYIVDCTLYELSDYFMDELGISRKEALNRINTGAYKIYITADLKMQEYIENVYADYSNIYPSGYGKNTGEVDEEGNAIYEYPQSSFIVMNYEGEIQAVVGGIGEKTASLSLLRPIQSKRQPGSCIKPVSTYGLGLANDLITWSTKYVDSPITINGKNWPTNFDRWTGANYFIYRAIEVSKNTVPARILRDLGTDAVYSFMTDSLHFSTLVAKDVDFAPLAVGGLTYGTTLDELANAYMVYGNGGIYYDSSIISMVYDANGGELINHEKKFGEQAVDEQTAYVMNRLLRRVVANSSDGTGRYANLPDTEVCGKTGTSQDFKDLGFVGLTPDYVSAIWLGYDETYTFSYSSYPNSSKTWYNVFGEYANSTNQRTHTKFPVSEDVQELYFCTSTGLIAGDNCPKSSIPGYYKSTNIPGTCTSH